MEQTLVITEKPSVAQNIAKVLPEQLQSPSMTADWEEKLLAIERGKYSPEDLQEKAGHVVPLTQDSRPRKEAVL